MDIYVANFPGTVTCADLRALFSKFGLVTGVELALDSFTGVSRGFGQVTMPDADALIAIAQLHETEWHGLRLEVREAVAQRKQAGSYPSSAGKVTPYTFRKNQ